ncbi:MAG: GatB/YqeY domain-containing protein [Mariprofundaceae bacterium]|nr:GatB/YqeY domain-containing protein [Mariprofundaceae bacterium]
MLNTIMNDMKLAMKAKDSLRLNAIRMFRAALKDKEIELKTNLTDTDVIAIASRLIKQRKDAATQYLAANRQDLADKELAEVDVLAVYLPKQMHEQAVTEAVAQAIAKTGATAMKDMGKVMAVLKPSLQGKTDMSLVSKQVKAALT